MTLKEQIILTILGINNADILRKLLKQAEKFRQQEKSVHSSEQDPTGFLPTFSDIRVVTVEQALSTDYKYPRFPKESIVGQWPGDESVEELLQMLNS